MSRQRVVLSDSFLSKLIILNKGCSPPQGFFSSATWFVRLNRFLIHSLQRSTSVSPPGAPRYGDLTAFQVRAAVTQRCAMGNSPSHSTVTQRVSHCRACVSLRSLSLSYISFCMMGWSRFRRLIWGLDSREFFRSSIVPPNVLVVHNCAYLC